MGSHSDFVPQDFLETCPGELELRGWLEDQGNPDATAWVTLLSREAGRLFGEDRGPAAVRFLELAASPASPVFEGLTGPRARELGQRLKRAHGGRLTPSWDERFQDVLAVLERWVRYRRSRRKELEERTPRPRRTEAPDTAEVEEYYRNWVLTPLRENFLRLLEDRGVSRRQFCASLGISEAYLSQILNGRRNPSLRKLSEMSRALEVDLGRLFAVRAHRGGGTPWAEGGERPEPGDTPTWYPGKVSRPYAALEAHYRLVFYPGPDLPGEKILARSHLIVDPVPGELTFKERYALQDADGVVLVVSFAGTTGGGKRQRFMTADGRTLEVSVAESARSGGKPGEAHILGRVTGTLVEF